MKLSRFKELDRKKQAIFIGGISVVLLVAMVFIYRTYAIYQESQDFNVINGSVPEYMNNYDVRLSLTIDGVEASEFPTRDSGKVFLNAECDKGAVAGWDYTNWMVQVKNVTETRTKCKYHFVSKYSDSILNGADPVLADGLIPVIIDESGVVRKASLGSEWYNYSNKIWANSVILDNPSVVYVEGEIIPESNIESYFVWIPRYRYKIFNEGNYTGLASAENRVQTIEIEFENKERTISTGSKVGEWLTHPAFVSFNTNGIWVGKFETGYKGANSTEGAQQNVVDTEKIEIKPNVYSWRGIQVANAHLNSYNYKREMESHMMKNTEWGSVAYLQHSNYGSMSSVRINNNSAQITGYSAKDEPTIGYTGTNESRNVYESTALGVDGVSTLNYKNPSSVVASTTGNYSGIYDMSGGSWEFAFGIMVDQSGNPVSGRNDKQHSNFIGALTSPESGNDKNKTSWTLSDGGISFPDRKYYDVYAYGEDDEHYNRRILGDATGEMGPFGNITYGSQIRQTGSWYQDDSWYVFTENPWVVRGAHAIYGTSAGIFNFSFAIGHAEERHSYRIVLSL